MKTKNIKVNKLKILISVFLFTSYFSQLNVNAQELELEYELLFELTAFLDDPIEIGETPYGIRTIYPVSGGSFEGPKIKGKVLPSGGDWFLMLDSTTAKLDVRGVIETDDGETIYTYYTGYIHFNPNGGYYFRTIPIFETSSKKYSWLNHTIAVGVGKYIDGGVAYKVYAIK